MPKPAKSVDPVQYERERALAALVDITPGYAIGLTRVGQRWCVATITLDEGRVIGVETGEVGPFGLACLRLADAATKLAMRLRRELRL